MCRTIIYQPQLPSSTIQLLEKMYDHQPQLPSTIMNLLDRMYGYINHLFYQQQHSCWERFTSKLPIPTTTTQPLSRMLECKTQILSTLIIFLGQISASYKSVPVSLPFLTFLQFHYLHFNIWFQIKITCDLNEFPANFAP